MPATAGPSSRQRVLRAGATTVIDYHDPDWAEEVIRATGGRGVSVYVRPDASQLEKASHELGAGRLEFTIDASFELEQAHAALERASAGRGGAGVLMRGRAGDPFQE